MTKSDKEVIRHVVQNPGVYVCYLGAGASAEAGVMTAGSICEAIRAELLAAVPSNDKERQREIDEVLEWNDESRTYLACIENAYPNKATRVAYFRKELLGVRPSFCHHAVALLMTNGYFRQTCLTTNFDKLLEAAFVQQGKSECQPIRTDAELEFLEDQRERYFVLKLHGDCDTANILNTADETTLISDDKLDVVGGLLRKAGMLVVGTAGNEKSVQTMFNRLSERPTSEHVLSYGLLWGVYMGPAKPPGITDSSAAEQLHERLSREVGRDIRDMIKRGSKRNELFSFFPVWGAGNFLLDLVRATGDKEMNGIGERFLDHEMRLRHVFTAAGLSPPAIERHITSLKKGRPKASVRGLAFSWSENTVCTVEGKHSPFRLRIVYGDITSRSFLGDPEFRSVRRAVVSPEDTCISAGGGVALGLLEKAGGEYILNELAKLAPIEHGDAAVTSGGNLPVHYILHAAALKIGADAHYSVSREDVSRTMKAVLELATVLEVGALWVPLMGTGVASLGQSQSLRGILEAIAQAKASRRRDMTVIVVIYKENEFHRNEVLRCVRSALRSSFRLRVA
jgi:O-acetyl-ADP-ribose deacetylase (regulator of RNase III)/NAD-dependent SIR2 family protein deacetylase